MELKRTAAPLRVPSAVADQDWISFPGGELEGRRPKTLCGRCRAALSAKVQGRAESSATPFVCFDCYKADQERERRLKAATEFVADSDEHFQSVLPLEPVNQARLARLRVERTQARVEARSGNAQYVDR